MGALHGGLGLMGTYYCLADLEKKEYINFSGSSKHYEILLNKIPSMLVVQFVFDHGPNHIAFVGDETSIYDPVSGKRLSYGEEIYDKKDGWKNVTQDYLDDLVEDAILRVKDSNADFLFDRYEVIF
jgi:hypothetical protein